jgi:hypothetical protein
VGGIIYFDFCDGGSGGNDDEENEKNRRERGRKSISLRLFLEESEGQCTH